MFVRGLKTRIEGRSNGQRVTGAMGDGLQPSRLPNAGASVTDKEAPTNHHY